MCEKQDRKPSPITCPSAGSRTTPRPLTRGSCRPRKNSWPLVPTRLSWPPSQLEPKWKLRICRYCRLGKQDKSLLGPVAGPARFVHCRAATTVVCSYVSYLHVPVDNDSPDAGQVRHQPLGNQATCPALVWLANTVVLP